MNLPVSRSPGDRPSPTMIEENDHRTRRCPMLGHEVQFSHRRSPAAPQPCRKIFDCWWEQFDIALFLEQQYDPAVIRSILQPPQPKALSLLEMIAEAKKNAGQ